MIRTRWQKVLIDLWKHRARTLVVALAIAVGVYAVGVVLTTQEMVVREYESDQADALMASAILHTWPFNDELAERISELPGVAAAEGRVFVSTRFYDETGKRVELLLVAIPDFAQMKVDAIAPLEGKWPPGDREVILERQALAYLGVSLGDVLTLALGDGTEKQLSVVGTAHDAQQLSPDITARPTGYIALKTVGRLGLDESYTQMHIRVEEQNHERAHIQAIVDGIEDQLERTGRPILGKRIITESIAAPFISTISLILSSFGLIILLLSGSLVINAISALIAQQIPQIGVMKLVGGRRWQIMSLYVVTVLAYGVLAVALGVPAAILTARLLMDRLVASLINVRIDSYAIPPLLLVIQVAVGLLLPLLAGLLPVIRGTSITTHKALNDVGVAAGAYGRGWVERLLGHVQRVKTLERPLLLAFRNTLRHKARLVQTLLVLTLGTALFISVLSVWASVDATVESFMQYDRYDVSLRLERPYRVERIRQVAARVPGVVDVEGWSVGEAAHLRTDGTEGDGMKVYAVPATTTYMTPQATAGRWLPGPGQQAIVVNSDVVDAEPDIGVGSELELDIGGRTRAWRVVGIVPTKVDGPTIYMDLEDYAHLTRTAGQATDVQVVTAQHDAAFQEVMEDRLFERFEAQGLEVSSTQTTEVMRSENKLMFTIVVAFLVLMAVLLAAVGGLGLASTMSINVLERVREIGVLRAIGAANTSVRRIVLAEGVVMGLLSWGAGTVLSLPVSAFMSEQLGLALIKIPLAFKYSVTAAVLWFFVLQGVAIVASLGPARNAVRLTVREVLAYE